MKKKLILLSTVLSTTAVLFLSSCLKDNSHYVNFNTGETFVDFPLGGFVSFSTDAITDAADTAAANLGNVERQFAVNVASANVPTVATTIQFKVGDPADVTAINSLQSNVVYTLMPAADYTVVTSITVPAGQQYATTSIKIHKDLLDPSLSYVIPVRIISATNGDKISANLGIHYFHIIGNDFAGSYIWDYIRSNADHELPPPYSGGTAFGQAGSISPVTPTEFQMITGYNGQGVRYDVTFTRTVSGGVVSYSNWAVNFVTSDVTGIWNAAGITVLSPPVFQVLDPVKKTFTLQYLDFNGTADRYIIDSYHK